MAACLAWITPACVGPLTETVCR